MDLADKTVLVTGANRGIGLSFVEALIDRGVAEIIAGVRTPATSTHLVERFGSRVRLVPLDMSRPASIDAALAEIGAIDLLVSNAGMSLIGPFFDHGDAAVREMFEVNLFGPLRLVAGLLPTLTGCKGGIIYVLSMASLLPAPDAEAYSASKAGATMIAHGVRRATAEHGLPISMVYPGFVDTDLGRNFDLQRANPRQIAERAIEGWQAGTVSIFPDVFAQMARDSYSNQIERVFRDPTDLVVDLVTEFVGRPDAGQ